MEAKANSTMEWFAESSVKQILLDAVKQSILSHQSMASQVLRDSKVFDSMNWLRS